MSEKTKIYKWHKLAESQDELPWQDNGLCEMTIAGKKVCLARTSDKPKACAARCPHAGGHMSTGYLDPAGNIVCPLHRYRFSLENGRNVSGEGYYLKPYPIEMRDDGVYIGFEEGGWLGLFK